MKKMLIALFVLLTLSVSVSSFATPWHDHGPAPNSGDCLPDGSGW